MSDLLDKLITFSERSKQSSYPMVLLAGKAGTGKTTMIGRTFPNPIILLDCDDKAMTQDNLRGQREKGNLLVLPIREDIGFENLIKFATTSTAKKKGSGVPDKIGVEPPKGYLRTLSTLSDIYIEISRDPNHPLIGGTLALDSITQLSFYLELLRAYTNGAAYLTLEGWGGIFEDLSKFFIDLKKLAKYMHIVVTVHKALIGDTSEDMGKNLHSSRERLEWEFTVRGSTKYRLASYFNEVYQLGIVPTVGSPKYTCRTIPDYDEARTSMNIGKEVEPDFRKICEKAGLSHYFKDRPEGFFKRS